MQITDMRELFSDKIINAQGNKPKGFKRDMIFYLGEHLTLAELSVDGVTAYTINRYYYSQALTLDGIKYIRMCLRAAFKRRLKNEQ